MSGLHKFSKNLGATSIIRAARYVTCSKFHTEGPQILDANVQNSFVPSTCCPGYMHTRPMSTRCVDKFLARPTSRCILFDGENISFDASLVIPYYSSNCYSLLFLQLLFLIIPPIVIPYYSSNCYSLLFLQL